MTQSDDGVVTATWDGGPVTSVAVYGGFDQDDSAFWFASGCGLDNCISSPAVYGQVSADSDQTPPDPLVAGSEYVWSLDWRPVNGRSRLCEIQAAFTPDMDVTP